MGGNFFPASSRPARLLVSRLVLASRRASRPFYPAVLLLARIALVRLIRSSRPSSRLARRLVGRLVSPSRLACSSHSSCCRFPWSSRSIPLPSSLRLVISSCRGRLAYSPRLFSIRLSHPALRIWIGRSCGGACSHINPMGVRSVSLWLVRSLLARHEVVMRYPWPSCVIRP